MSAAYDQHVPYFYNEWVTYWRKRSSTELLEVLVPIPWGHHLPVARERAALHVYLERGWRFLGGQ